ncbi:oligosaccharide flippase family protein [Sphingosinicella rhizophila]|uniref:Oligosaccharide flippase family protein n=1 Tax=Sphingosinicella rhizophila TaxID=3050082 RepID=A0ABU3Q3M2_9SPHN|nr:oligosaccharide flippase family protein [Sphingosinicella sp. GR2756]MDT9598010.1 oligosaccharide flippase family protein [Sphingosinicella sp. GR2756]
MTKRTISGVVWQTGGRLVQAMIGLLVVAILARLLTPAEFGVVAAAIAVVNLGIALNDGTFGLSLIQRKRIGARQVTASFVLAFWLGVLLALIVSLVSPWVAAALQLPTLQAVLVVASFLLPMGALASVETALLQRAGEFRQISTISMASQILGGLISITLAIGGYGPWALIWGQLAAAAFNAAPISLLATRHRDWKISRTALAVVGHSSGIFTLYKLLSWGSGNAGRLVERTKFVTVTGQKAVI